jgi:hypothetical protein
MFSINNLFLVIVVIAILLCMTYYFIFRIDSGSGSYKREYLNKSNIFDQERLNEPATRDETSMRGEVPGTSMFNILGDENGDEKTSVMLGGLYRRKMKKNKRKKSLHKKKYRKYKK